MDISKKEKEKEQKFLRGKSEIKANQNDVFLSSETQLLKANFDN